MCIRDSTWTATDTSGNSASATQTVTIVDTKRPGLSIPQDQTVEASSLEGTLVEIGQAEAHDITGISSIVHNAPNVFPLGSTVIAWTATDNHDNTTTAYQRITVVDTTAPIIISPQDILAEAVDPTMNYIGLGELDASDSVGIESVTNDKPITFPFGSTTVTWTVTDTSGNISQATQVVTLVDTTLPEIFAPTDIVAEATGLSNTMVELGEATANDIMGIASVTEHPSNFFVLGETTITWTATDTSGNSVSATQTVTIVDTTLPSITAPSSITMEATSSDSNIVTLGNPASSDLVDIPSISNNAPDVFPLELNTMPGWAGSSWYFYRYMDPKNNNEFISDASQSYWSDVDVYFGGSEHATGHLLYSRFYQKFLFDLDFLQKDEYAKRLVNQGMILGNSAFIYRKSGTSEYFSKNLINNIFL